MIKPSPAKSDLNNRPIGVFDSGLGGLTVVNQLIQYLPQESIVYFGDTARVPYGTKSPETIRKFAVQITRYLQSQGVKLIVVACNTVSSVAMENVVELSSVPVIGVIQPGARAALQKSKNRRIGVIGTSATVSAGKYNSVLSSIAPDVVVFAQACPLFVPLVEEGWIDSEVTEMVARIYLEPLIRQSIDTLILGCTHYPIIKDTIKKIVDKDIEIVDSAIQTALEVRAVLSSNNLLNDSGTLPEHLYYVSDFPQKFEDIARRLLGQPLKNIRRISLDDCTG
ncbi:MAG: glutamate racemase [bacterium]